MAYYKPDSSVNLRTVPCEPVESPLLFIPYYCDGWWVRSEGSADAVAAAAADSGEQGAEESAETRKETSATPAVQLDGEDQNRPWA